MLKSNQVSKKALKNEGFFWMNEKIFYNSSYFKSKYLNRLRIEV